MVGRFVHRKQQRCSTIQTVIIDSNPMKGVSNSRSPVEDVSFHSSPKTSHSLCSPSISGLGGSFEGAGKRRFLAPINRTIA